MIASRTWKEHLRPIIAGIVCKKKADVPNSGAGTGGIEQFVEKQALHSWYRLAQGFVDSFKGFA